MKDQLSKRSLSQADLIFISLLIGLFASTVSTQVISLKSKDGRHLLNEALQKYINQDIVVRQTKKQVCGIEDGPYCIISEQSEERHRGIMKPQACTSECIQPNQTNPDESFFDEQFYEVQTDQDLAFNELKSNENIGTIQITTGLTFDDLSDQFKNERYQQTSIPLHALNVFQKSQVKGTIRGALLARTQLTFSYNRNKLFDSKTLNNKLDNMESSAQAKSGEQAGATSSNMNPKSVYALVHSKEVNIEFSKAIHLDHFHYRVNSHYQKPGQSFYIRTYDKGRLVLDISLKGDQQTWLKVTFPKSKVLIDTIVISQGIELDNISLIYILKIKSQISYFSLESIHVSNYQQQNNKVPKVNMEDFSLAFKEYEHMINTLDMISDVVHMQQLEKAILDSYNPKLPKSTRLQEVLLESVKYLEALGITIIYHIEKIEGELKQLETNLSLAISQKVFTEDQILMIALNLAKFQRH